MPITVEMVRSNLETKDRWVERGILALYARQTEFEKATKTTIENNKRGFDAFDAKTGSYMARWLLSGRPLSGYWLRRARKMALKYAIQLTAIAIVKEQLSKLESSKGATCPNAAQDSQPSSPQSTRPPATNAQDAASPSRTLEPSLPGM